MIYYFYERPCEALNLLREAARKTHSQVLARFAQRLSLHKSDAFGEVNNQIEKMIFKLMDEQTQEDEHKLWCDKEVSKTDASIEDKTDKLEELDGKINKGKTKYQTLTGEIADAQKMIADITSFMEEATDIRATGKEENALALKDAQDSQTALANAIAVLEQFYKESGMVEESFLQRGAAPVELPKDPSTWPPPQPSGGSGRGGGGWAGAALRRLSGPTPPWLGVGAELQMPLAERFEHTRS